LLLFLSNLLFSPILLPAVHSLHLLSTNIRRRLYFLRFMFSFSFSSYEPSSIVRVVSSCFLIPSRPVFQCTTDEQRELARFQVLTAASMRMAVFWVVAPCSLLEVYRRFRGACCPPSSGQSP
jgi:hypothetical protein